MGKKPAKPVTYQYADAYTPYGPIVGADEGFAFFTLRPISSGGFFAMPGNRHNMPCRAGRNLAGQFDLERPRPPAGETVSENLMAPQADGVDAVGLRLGPGAIASGVPSDAGGQYYLICGGDVEHAGKHLPFRSLLHLEPGEHTPEFIGGQDGAEILVLQFARPTGRPGSDPRSLAVRDPEAYMSVPAGSGR